jgi:hypothetical protein
MDDYAAFLASKAPAAQAVGLDRLPPLNPALFDFQLDVTAFALRQGRAGLFLDTGLGKTLCQLEFCSVAAEASNGRALILTPLAVARQIEREGEAFGYAGAVRVIRDQGESEDGINVCNYDRLDKLDPEAFGAVSLDEAGILKNFTGRTSRALIAAFRGHRFKLSATATPAPNDHMELGQQSEFLGIMPSNEMLMRWFISDQTQMGRYRLKGHATESFWDWMASWSRMATSPEDLGFDGRRFVLPELVIHRHRAREHGLPATGGLFVEALSATTVFEEKRRTEGARADTAAAVVSAEPQEPWVIWCDTDSESAALAARLPDAVEVKGSHPIDLKEERIAAFVEGEASVLITKPSICAWGLNLQRCARMLFAGRTFSYEAYYQAVRRCWRFGQRRPVHVHLVVSEAEDAIGRVIDRKAEDHAKMKRAMALAMRRAREERARLKTPYEPKHLGRMPAWL